MFKYNKILVILLSQIGLLFSWVPSVGDTISGKIHHTGISVADKDAQFVCRYVAPDSSYAIWTPFEVMKVYSFVSSHKNSPIRLVFSEKGLYKYVYNGTVNAMEWNLMDPSPYHYAVFHPLGTNQYSIFALSKNSIKVLSKVTFTIKVEYYITDYGDTLTPNSIDLKGGPDSLYVATNKGIYVGVGLPDKIWTKLGNLSDPINTFVIYKDTVFAGGPFGFYLWDGTQFLKLSSENVTNMLRADTFVFVSTTDKFYRFDVRNPDQWTSVADFKVDAMMQFSPDTLLVAVSDTGVMFYQISTNSFVYKFPNDGLKELKTLGSMTFHSLDVYPAGSQNIFLGTDLCGFVFDPNTQKWRMFAGLTTDGYKFVRIQGVTYTFYLSLGFNVDSKAIDTLLPFLDSLFVTTGVFDSVKKHYKNFFGVDYPDVDGFDGVNIILYPLIVPVADPGQGYYPDPLPIIGYFSEALYKDASHKLKESILLDPLEFYALPSASKKAFVDYLLWEMGIYENKDFESEYVCTGFAMALAKQFEKDSVLEEGLIPDSLHGNYLPPYLLDDVFYVNPNRNLLIMSTTQPTIPDPSEPDREKLVSFFSYLLEKYDTTWAQILKRKRYTGLDLLKFIISLKGDTFENEVAKWRNTLVENKRLHKEGGIIDTLESKIIALQPYSGVYLKVNVADTFVFDVENGNNVQVYKITTDTLYNILNSERIFLDSTTFKAYVITDSDPSTYEIFALTNLEPYEVYISYGYRRKLPPYLNVVLIQNPGIENEIDIYGWNDSEAIYVDPNKKGFMYRMYKIGTDTTVKKPALIPVTDQLSENLFIYKTSFTLNDQGTFIFDYLYQDKSGNMNIVAQDTISVFVLSGSSQTFSLWNGELNIYIPENSVYGKMFIHKEGEHELAEIGIIPEDYLDQGLSKVYILGNKGVNVNKEFYITLRNPVLMNQDVNLYRFENGSWVVVPANIDRNEGVLTAKLSAFGMYQLRKGGGILAGDKVEFIIPSLMNTTSGIKLFVPYRANIKMEIYNVTGRKLTSLERNFSPGIYILNTSNLKSGVYFLKGYVNGNEKIRKKFIYFVK